MIDGLKPYPVMKDSGVPWLGQVPEHWEVQRLKSLADNVVDQTDTRRDGELYVALEHVESWTGRLRSPSITVEFASQVKRFRPSDVLFGKLRPYLAKVHRPTQAGVCVGEFLVLRPRSRLHSHFLEYVLRSAPAIDLINSWTFGAKMPRVEWDVVGNVQIALGPFDEQRAIVRFLDHADRLIRRYIGAKRKLIRLLEEQKQAIIHRAVTRGLDPNVRLKPSGVEWLGDVPAHWEVRRGKYYFREVDERSSDGSEELMSVSHKTGVTPRSEKNITMFMAESYVGHKLCRPGDIVVNTMWGWMAAVGVACQLGVVSPSYGVYRSRQPERYRPQYLDLLLRTELYRSEYVRSSRGITTSRLRLYPDEFLRIAFLCPPLQEQDTILGWVENATAELRRSITAANREIDLLREYRTRLIADVVTGKLDVRAAAAALPEPQEAPDDLEAEAEAPAEEELEIADEEEVEKAAA